MENKLKALFDFQKFDGNAELQGVIHSVHSRYQKRELGLDEMEMVNAAGITDVYPRKEEEKKR